MRALALLALAAALGWPAPAPAQSRGDAPTLRGAALVGFDTGDLDGVGIRLDGEVDLQRLAPDVVVSGVGSFGYSRVSEDFPEVEQSAHLFSLVPALRLRFELTPETGPYADLGLGLYLAGVDNDFRDGRSTDDTDVDFMMRFGLGWFVWPSENVRFQIEASLSPHFGDYNDTTFQLLLGAAFPLN